MSTTYIPTSGYAAYYSAEGHQGQMVTFRLPVVAIQYGPVQPGGSNTAAMVLDAAGHLVAATALTGRGRFVAVQPAPEPMGCACS